MAIRELRVLNLGAGWQSTAMYIAAAVGDLEPMPDVAIFADTQAEPFWVYENLDRLDHYWGATLPIRRVTRGSLKENLYFGNQGRSGFVQIPAFMKRPDGKRGMGRRQCTYQYKIRPIEEECRRLAGLKPRQWAKGKIHVEQWIGISTDEAHRAKPSNTPWITRHYPLLYDLPMNREACKAYAESHGIRNLKKSACTFCPFHHDNEWRELRQHAPAQFAEAVQIDRDLREPDAMKSTARLRQPQYLHSSLVPLGEIDFDDQQSDQADPFGNECEGVCGV